MNGETGMINGARGAGGVSWTLVSCRYSGDERKVNERDGGLCWKGEAERRRGGKAERREGEGGLGPKHAVGT